MKSHLRGFVLLTTMLFTLVLGMIVYAAMLRLPATKARRNHGLAAQRARAAALSGLEYAACQLRAEPSWSGGKSRETKVDLNGLSITQNRGNVLGEITELDGTKSQFRIRFNHQDGNDGADDQNDPSPRFMFEFPYISVNNLGTDEESRTPHSGVPIPGRSVCLFVEGSSTDQYGRPVTRVFEGIYQVSTDGRTKDAAVMAAGDLTFLLRPNGAVVLGGSLIRHATDDLLRLRTKGKLSVTRDIENGGGKGRIEIDSRLKSELSRDSSAGGVEAVYPVDRVTEVQEQLGDGRDFYNLPWSGISQADRSPDSTSSIQIPGGVYVYGRNPDTSEREFRYFDMTYAQYLRNAEALSKDSSRGVVLSSDFREVRKKRNMELNPDGFRAAPSRVAHINARTSQRVISDGFRWSLTDTDLRILSSSRGNDGIAIIPRSPAKLDYYDNRTFPKNVNDPYTADDMRLYLTNTSFSADGPIHIQSSISGRGGTIVTGDKVEIVGGRAISILGEITDAEELEREIDQMTFGDLAEDDPDGDGSLSSLQLNVYSRKDMILSTYVERQDRYRDMAFQGLLYSWGNVSLKAARPDNPRRGKIKLRGALVAYGGQPISEEPGSGRGGNVKIEASDTKLIWDPRFLPSLGALQSEGSASPFTLERVILGEMR